MAITLRTRLILLLLLGLPFSVFAEFGSQSACRPSDPSCGDSTYNKDQDNEPYAGPIYREDGDFNPSGGSDSSRFRQRQNDEQRRRWEQRQMPDGKEIGRILNAPVGRMNYWQLDDLRRDIQHSLERYADVLTRNQQQQIYQKLRDVENEIDYLNRNRPLPPPGLEPLPPPFYD